MLLTGSRSAALPQMFKELVHALDITQQEEHVVSATADIPDNLTDVVFLDFDSLGPAKRGETEGRLDVLGAARTLFLGTPLIVFTKHRDALTWRRCYTSGADLICIIFRDHLGVTSQELEALKRLVQRARFFRLEEYWRLLQLLDGLPFLPGSLVAASPQFADLGTLRTAVSEMTRQVFYYYRQIVIQGQNKTLLRQFLLAVGQLVESLCSVLAIKLGKPGSRKLGVSQTLDTVCTRCHELSVIESTIRKLAITRRNDALYRPTVLQLSEPQLRDAIVDLADAIVRFEVHLQLTTLPKKGSKHHQTQSVPGPWDCYQEQCSSLGLETDLLSGFDQWHACQMEYALARNQRKRNDYGRRLQELNRKLEWIRESRSEAKTGRIRIIEDARKQCEDRLSEVTNELSEIQNRYTSSEKRVRVAFWKALLSFRAPSTSVADIMASQL